MAQTKLTVVVSQGQGKHPARQAMEENVAAALIFEPGVELSVVPHLYDLSEGHTGLMFLQSVKSDMVVLSWLYPRAAHWTLDRMGVKGRIGETELKKPVDPEDEDEDEAAEDEEAPAEKKTIIGAAALPDRTIWCLDLRAFPEPDSYIKEIKRLVGTAKPKTGLPKMLVDLTGWLHNAPKPQPQAATNGHSTTNGHSHSHSHAHEHAEPAPTVVTAEQLLTTPDRRWYPVIDYDRCTNCMQCIDFCLFGVYGVDGGERILVENQDNCRKGCPACSRVCPEHAIIFPQHKSSAIAGDEGAGPGGLKIDLSRLFGGGAAAGSGALEIVGDALAVAAKERDEQLALAGRETVGMSVGIPKRQADKPKRDKDDLDKLVDALDDF